MVREFYSNLANRDGFSIYVQDKWVPFDAATINRVYDLKDGDSDAYKALFHSPEINGS